MIDGYVDRNAVRAVREILGNSDRRKEIGQHNHRIASRHFSYDMLRNRLETVLKNLFGDPTRLEADRQPADNVVAFSAISSPRQAAAR